MLRRRYYVPAIPPTINHSHKVARSGHIYKVPKAVSFEKIAQHFIKADHEFAHVKCVNVHFLFLLFHEDFFEINRELRRNDTSNLKKLLEDSLAESIGLDDKCFVTVTGQKCWTYKRLPNIRYHSSALRGITEVTVEELPDAVEASEAVVNRLITNVGDITDVAREFEDDFNKKSRGRKKRKRTSSK